MSPFRFCRPNPLEINHFMNTAMFFMSFQEVPPTSGENVTVMETTFNNIPVHVYVPTLKSEILRRSLVYIHGGGWCMGDRHGRASSASRQNKLCKLNWRSAGPGWDKVKVKLERWVGIRCWRGVNTRLRRLGFFLLAVDAIKVFWARWPGQLCSLGSLSWTLCAEWFGVAGGEPGIWVRTLLRCPGWRQQWPGLG